MQFDLDMEAVMTKFAYVQGLAIVAVVLVGCGGGDAGGGTDESGKSPSAVSTAKPHPTTTSASPTEPPPAATACVVKGDKGNELGVGAYCDKTVHCPDGQICGGDFGAPVGASFCTIPCGADSECGSSATCYHDARGNGCAPIKCQSK